MTAVTYRDYSGAELYERDFVPAIATPVAGELMRTANLQPGERVLDVACGTGLITRLAAERVGPTGSVTGIDIAPDMIAVAKTVPVPTAPVIDWRIADATALDVPDDSYDVVTCQMGLMFIEDRPRAIAEMRRVLVPGGRLVVNTPGVIQPPFELMEKAIVDHISPDLGGFIRAIFSIPDPDVLADLLRDAGLRDVTARTYTAAFRLPPPAEFLWQYINLTPMAPFVARAPEDAKAAMEREVVEGLEPYVSDGRTPLDQPMGIGTGRK